MTLWFISDTHFGHQNIIEYCSRPFVDAAEMDERLISNWNAFVKPSDHVYHLGDVTMAVRSLAEVMPRLNGHKRLVRGNHDIYPTKKYAPWFEEIYGVRVLDNLLFTHIPVHPSSLGRFRANVHGHTHERSYEGRYINICVEQTEYCPITLDEVKRRVIQRERLLEEAAQNAGKEA